MVVFPGCSHLRVHSSLRRHLRIVDDEQVRGQDRGDGRKHVGSRIGHGELRELPLSFIAYIGPVRVGLATSTWRFSSQIFSKMGSTGRRALPLLRALSFNLQKQRGEESDPQSRLNMRHVSNCLYAMSKLSFIDRV